VAQAEGPEFKPQCHKRRERERERCIEDACPQDQDKVDKRKSEIKVMVEFLRKLCLSDLEKTQPLLNI
jgi:hypothetical protein